LRGEPNFERGGIPPERYIVTIAAGFYINGGIVLCADTQETVGIAKTWTPKLIVEPDQPEFLYHGE
jgi:hypothetical protein